MSLRPLILLYHGVPQRGQPNSLDAAAFDRQVQFLKRHATFIQPQEYLSVRGSQHRPAVLLTFDDGLRNNAEVVVPILRRHQVPAVFFVSSRHCTPGRYLWFTYLSMLGSSFPGHEVVLNGKIIRLDGKRRDSGLSELTSRLLALKPHPEAMYTAIEEQLPPLQEFVSSTTLADECEGMTADQLHEIANDPLFTIASHTVDHPYLTMCSPEEAYYQISENKTWLERATGKSCDLFAYPLGDSSKRLADCCRDMGFQQAFGVESNPIADDNFCIRRIGIYSSSSWPLATKVWCGHWLPIHSLQRLHSFGRTMYKIHRPVAVSFRTVSRLDPEASPPSLHSANSYQLTQTGLPDPPSTVANGTVTFPPE